MPLDLDNAVKIVSEHAAGFAKSFGEILVHPVRRFSYSPAKAAIQMKPTFWSFVILSIFLGSTVDAAIPDFKLPDFAVTLVITVLCWTAFCAIIQGLCRLLHSHSTFEHTFVVSLQVLAVIYVISHFTAFLVSRFPTLAGGNRSIYGVITYLVIQSVLLVTYLPSALRAVHRLSAWSWVVFPPVILVAFTGVNFLLFGYGLIVGWDFKHMIT